MLIDTTLLLSDAQEVKTSGPSENVIDQLGAGGAHTHAAIIARVDETFAGATQVKISLQTAKESSFAESEELLAASFSAADLQAGQVLLSSLFPKGAQRYLRGYYTVTGTGTAGKLSLFVADAADMQ